MGATRRAGNCAGRAARSLWRVPLPTAPDTCRAADLDSATGEIKSRKNFSDRPLLDRVIGYGVAIHEGQLFGWFNQLLGLLTALGLVLLSVSSVILWWRRRSPGMLGAPQVGRDSWPYAYTLIAIIVLLGVLLPFLGMTLLAVLFIDRWVLRTIPSARNFLGLSQVVVDHH